MIQETSEGESEKLTTRVIANYNHMHALNMQFYEAVQNYRVVTRATHYERCLFIPFKAFDFTDPRVLFKHRQILEAYALEKQVCKDLQEIDYTQLWEKLQLAKQAENGETVGTLIQSSDQDVTSNESEPQFFKIVVTDPMETDVSKATTEHIIPIPNPRVYKISGNIEHPNITIGDVSHLRGLRIGSYWSLEGQKYYEDFYNYEASKSLPKTETPIYKGSGFEINIPDISLVNINEEDEEKFLLGDGAAISKAYGTSEESLNSLKKVIPLHKSSHYNRKETRWKFNQQSIQQFEESNSFLLFGYSPEEKNYEDPQRKGYYAYPGSHLYFSKSIEIPKLELPSHLEWFVERGGFVDSEGKELEGFQTGDSFDGSALDKAVEKYDLKTKAA